jgi:hypothetical protein
MGKPGIDKIQSALITLMQGATELSYVPDNQIQSIDAGVDFNTLEIIVAPPAVLVQYDGAAYETTTSDESGYKIEERFTLIAVVSSIAGKAQTMADLQALLEDLKTVIVKGRRMTVDTDKIVHAALLGVVIFENLFYPHGQNAYGLQIRVRGNSWEYSS